MRIIRNRIAHSSKHSEDKFRKLVIQILGYNPTRRGMVPGRLLLHEAPPTMTKTIMKKYGDLLTLVSRKIVP